MGYKGEVLLLNLMPIPLQQIPFLFGNPIAKLETTTVFIIPMFTSLQWLSAAYKLRN